MAADPGNYPAVGSPGQGVRWEGRSSVPEGLRLWAPCMPKFRWWSVGWFESWITLKPKSEGEGMVTQNM